ncbi:MAG: transporter substrate-binding domain-containing protein [Colwellia sp.]|nr:transporter substrate-binding domain-containing protein [Colwellia sp.]
MFDRFLRIVFIFAITGCYQVTFAESDLANFDRNKIEMVDGLVKPPFIIEENGQGLQLDIVRSALKSSNKEVHFIHVPFGRNVTTYQSLNADGIVTVLPDYQHPNLFISRPFITYQNVAVSLIENKFSIKNIGDLSGKSMVAFQNANKNLGDDFNKVIRYAMDYREVAEQENQIDMLFLHRAEVIILDINIFKYFLEHGNSARYSQPVKVHYIFNERQYSAAFKSEQIRNLFDQGIKTMREEGSYQIIVDKYLDQQ